jgi:hypothetical protein
MSCPSGKVRYRTRIDAKIALANTHRKAASTREETRIYFCPNCRGQHLTSRPQR